MDPAANNASSAPIPGRRALLGVFALTALLAGAAVILLSARVAAPILAAGLVLLLAAAAAAAVTLLHKANGQRTRWHDVMPCYFSLQDKDLRIIKTNELFRRDFGDRTGEHCHLVYKGSEDPCPNCPVLATFRDGKIHTSEETVITRNGEQAQVVVTSAPHFDEDGHLIGVVEMSTNVTEIKTLRRELERSRIEYQRLFELVPCYISVQDRDLNILESNELVKRDFGDCNGQRCYSIFKCRDEICKECVVAKSFEDGQVHCSEEITTTKDGRKVNLIVYSMPIHDVNGRIDRVMEVATDITEVKLLEHELTVIGKAVAGMAHRIKNILMGLEGGLFVVNTAFENDDDEAISQGWQMIERNVERVSHIVKDLLYCSKKRHLEFKDNVAPEKIAREVYDLFKERTALDEIDLVLDAGTPSPRTLNPDAIHSLITNLVTNAIDACRFDPDESKHRHAIAIRCHTDGKGETSIEVEDDGAGIPPELSGKVFEDFFSTKGTEGTGLGLLIINQVVEEHGGRITFTSQPGQGTRFTVRIPAALPKASSPTV